MPKISPLDETKSVLIQFWTKENKIHLEFQNLKILFSTVDIHPFDSGNQDEIERWGSTKQKMIDFLSELNN